MDDDDGGGLVADLWVGDEAVDGAVAVGDFHPFEVAGGFFEAFEGEVLGVDSEGGEGEEGEGAERAFHAGVLLGIKMGEFLRCRPGRRGLHAGMVSLTDMEWWVNGGEPGRRAMGVHCRYEGGVVVLSHLGHLMNDPRYASAAEQIQGELDEGRRAFVIELADVRETGDAFLGLLVGLTRQIRQAKGDVVLARPSGGC